MSRSEPRTALTFAAWIAFATGPPLAVAGEGAVMDHLSGSTDVSNVHSVVDADTSRTVRQQIRLEWHSNVTPLVNLRLGLIALNEAALKTRRIPDSQFRFAQRHGFKRLGLQGSAPEQCQ